MPVSPCVPPLDELALHLKRRLLGAQAGTGGTPHPPSVQDLAHLTWMVHTAHLEQGWPTDKRLRWLGYVAGALDGPGASAQPLEALSDPCLSQPIGAGEAVIQATTLAVLEDLVRRCRGAQDAALMGLAKACHDAPQSNAGSLRLGYLQAAMAQKGLLDPTAERDRTRPLFHRAYQACGWVPPATLNRGSTEDQGVERSQISGVRRKRNS